MVREIGGYFEFEKLVSNEWYKDYLRLNSARNCLRFIIRNRNIKKVYLPSFLCDSLDWACNKENVEVEHYPVDMNFLPIFDKELAQDEYICVVNYYGVLTREMLEAIKTKYKNIIVDNTQAFFMEALPNVDTIYSCRKYFGVPDGAYLATDLNYDNIAIKKGTSGYRIKHLIGRMEASASEYYDEFKKAEETFYDDDVEAMSELTENIMGAIDYDFVQKRRKENIGYLNSQLKDCNELKLNIEHMDFMYPLLIKRAEEIREILIKEKVFVPILWPNALENELAKDIIPLPIDQRYNKEDMEYICKIIRSQINEKN